MYNKRSVHKSSKTHLLFFFTQVRWKTLQPYRKYEFSVTFFRFELCSGNCNFRNTICVPEIAISGNIIEILIFPEIAISGIQILFRKLEFPEQSSKRKKLTENS